MDLHGAIFISELELSGRMRSRLAAVLQRGAVKERIAQLKWWLHLRAPCLADFCKQKTDTIWHDPTGLSCLSAGSDSPSFACLIVFTPGAPVGIFLPPLPASSAPSPCPLFHPQSFLAPSIQNKLYFDIYAVDEQVCACLLHTIQKGRGVCVC